MMNGMPNNEELIRRARVAYLKYADGPEPTNWRVQTYQDRTYVVARRGDRVVATYRYKPSGWGGRGQLLAMRRSPFVAAAAQVA